MEPSSQTPEGVPIRCDLCGHEIKVDPSDGTGDAPCPHCGYLLWFGTHGLPGKDRREWETTKRQIRRMINEIAELAKSGMAWRASCQQFLPRIVSCLAAPGGAIWTVNLHGELELQAHVNLQQTGLLENEEAQAEHARILHQVLTTGEPLLVPPHARLEDQQAANPTDFLLVFERLKKEGKVAGIVEIFQRPDAAPATQKGYVRFLGQMCEIATSPHATASLLDSSGKPQMEAAIRSRLPNKGENFLLRDAISAMEKFCMEDRQDENDILVASFRRFGRGAQRRVEIRLAALFGLSRYLELILVYPAGLRCLFLTRSVAICRRHDDAGQFILDIHRLRWYRRYAMIPAEECQIRWRDSAELGDLFA